MTPTDPNPHRRPKTKDPYPRNPVAEQKEALAEQLLHPGELLTVDPARREVEAE